MTNAQLFTAAHEITKKVIKDGDNYQATFSLCLKMIKNGEIAHEYSVDGAWNRDGSIDCSCTLDFIYGNGSMDWFRIRNVYVARKTVFVCNDPDMDIRDEKGTIYFQEMFNSKNVEFYID